MSDLAKRCRDHAELLRKMDEVSKPRQVTSPTQRLLREAADEIDKLNNVYLSAVKGRQDFRDAFRKERNRK